MVSLIKEYSSQGDQPRADMLYANMLYMALIQVLGSLSPPNKRRKKTDDVAKELKTYISDYLYEFHTEILNHPKWSIYVFCLSKKKDDLRQWRAYGDNARGVALEFKPTKMNSPNDITIRNIYDVSVSYSEPKSKKQFLIKFLENTGYLYNKNYVEITEKGKNTSGFLKFFQKLTNILLVDLVSWKNPQYEDEKEWRLFFLDEQPTSDASPQPKPSFYVKGGLLCPYYDFALKEGAITGIKMGAQFQNNLIDDFKMLCAKHGMPNLEITPSKMHYRG